MKNKSVVAFSPAFLVGNINIMFRPSVVVAFAYIMLLGLFTITRGYSALDFVHLGTIWAQHNPAGTWGYDGQFYYQIAHNPLNAYMYMDNASYRYQHILYGLVVGALSLGQPVLIPYMLLFVNLLSVVLSVEIVSRLLVKHGLSPWFSLAMGLYFGQAAANMFDTAEPFTYLLVCIGVWMLEEKNLTMAALLMGLATLSREIAVLFPAGYALYFLIRKDWQAFIRFTVLGILPLLLWLIILRIIFGKTGVKFAPPFEHRPFAGIFYYSQALRKFWLLILIILVPTVAGWIVIGRELLRRKFGQVFFVLLANLALITFMSHSSYSDLVTSGRIAVGLVLAVVLYGISTKNNFILWASQFYTLTFLVYIAAILLHVPSFLATLPLVPAPYLLF
jgi:hypothetical protein